MGKMKSIWVLCFYTYFQILVGTMVSTNKNVLFISVDDLRPELSPYLHVDIAGQIYPQISTPNIEQLASRSLVSYRAYSQFAICTPSRASVMTGRRPDTTHVYDLSEYFRETGGAKFYTIPQYFKEHSYTTVGIGKIFHAGTEANDDPISWTEPYYNPPNEWKSSRWSVRPLTPEAHADKPLPDESIANQTIHALREVANSGQNFFIAAGFHKPHLPFTFPEAFLDLYPLENISLPGNPYAPIDMPSIAWSTWSELRSYEDIAIHGVTGKVNNTLPDKKVYKLRQAYYSCVSYIDEMIGLMMDELNSLGLKENTIVVLWSDHGFLLGEHGGWCKHSNLELATHVPLIIHVPGLTDNGFITHNLVELVDIFPTVVEAAGLPALPLCPEVSTEIAVCTEGMSLLPLVQNQDNVNFKMHAFSQYPKPRDGVFARVMGYSVRDRRYRYTEFVGFNISDFSIDWMDVWGVELYDYETDPEGNFNIAEDASYASVVANMQEVLHQGWRSALPSSL